MTTDGVLPATEGQQTLWNTRPSLEVRAVAGQVDVRVGGMTLWSFRAGDTGSRTVAIAGLLEGGLFQTQEVAAAFGLKSPRVSQIKKRYREGGAALLLSTSPRVTGPRGLTAAEIDTARRWRREGMTLDEITAKANALWRKVSWATIQRHVGGGREVPLLPVEETTETPVVDASAAEVASSAAEGVEATSAVESVPTPAAAPIEPAVDPETEEAAPLAAEPPSEDATVTRPCTVAGAMVAHVALEKLGFRAALDASAARIGASLTFDLLRTAAVIVFGVILRYRSIDAMRHLVRWDFGALLGIRRAPEVRTIQRKLEEIAAPASGFDGAAFLRGLARGVLASEPAPEGVYFFDDHFKPYHGNQPLQKGWDAKRRIGAPGIEDVYVHDLKGRAILFVPLDAPTSLSCALPRALAELRKVAPTAPALAVFDRGGFSRDLFRSLVHPADGTPRLDFLTYLRERKERRELPESSFHKVSFEDGERTIEIEVAESTLAMKGFARPLRLIVLLDRKKRKQIPILTSDETTPAARLVHLLRARWRQENSFKYLVGELAIDALVSREMSIAPDTRLVDNPERILLKEQLSLARKDLAALDEKLAAAVVANDERQRRTVRGFKIAQADLTHPRKHALARIAALKEDIARLPAKVSRVSLDPEALLARPLPARRVFVNGLKLLVHNVEKWLADRMADGPYRSHALAILRALCDQPGTIRVGKDRVHVEVQPLDSPRYQRCVEHLFAALNAERATILDSGLPIEFSAAPAGVGPNRGKMS
jgi:hypothetical protein